MPTEDPSTLAVRRSVPQLGNSKRFYDEFIARGPDAIRILACAFPEYDDSDGQIAERLAAHRTKTEGLVRELVADAEQRVRTGRASRSQVSWRRSRTRIRPAEPSPSH